MSGFSIGSGSLFFSLLTGFLAILPVISSRWWRIGMKHFIQTGIVIGIGFVLWQVSADARFLERKKNRNRKWA